METKSKAKSMLCFSLGVIVLVLLDQLTKMAAQTMLRTGPRPLIPNVFELQSLENRGSAFGMLQGQRIFLF